MGHLARTLTGSPPEVGTDEVAELEQAVSLFRRWDASGAGGLRRKAVVGQLNAVAETLTGHYPADITQRLFQVTAELAQLAGWMATTKACSGWLSAVLPAGLARLPGRLLCPISAPDHRRYDPAIHRPRPLYEDSLTLVRTALYSLPRHAGSLVRSELLGLESRKPTPSSARTKPATPTSCRPDLSRGTGTKHPGKSLRQTGSTT